MNYDVKTKIRTTIMELIKLIALNVVREKLKWN